MNFIFVFVLTLIVCIVCALVLQLHSTCTPTKTLRMQNTRNNMQKRILLQCGDIVLSSANQFCTGRSFQKVLLNSPYTHVSMVIGKTPQNQTVLIEAVREGVRLIMLHTVLQHADAQHEIYVVRKLKPALATHQQIQLQRTALKCIGARYAFSAWKSILHAWQPFLSFPSSQHSHNHNKYKCTKATPNYSNYSYYCSELVAFLYTQIGIARFNKSLDLVLPCDFATQHPQQKLGNAFVLGKEYRLI